MDRQFIRPDIAIYEESKVDTIIDVKVSKYALRYKDYMIYPQKTNKLIFWILEGESHLEKYNFKIFEFISSEELIQKLNSLATYAKNDSKIQELVTRIHELKKARSRKFPEPATENNKTNLDKFV